MTASPRRVGDGPRLAAGVILLVALLAGGVVLVLNSANADLSSDTSALAKVDMPLGGGRIESVSAVTGPQSAPVPVQLRGEEIWPRRLLRPGQRISIDVAVKRPGWSAWFAGGVDRVHLTVVTPSTRLRQQYLTLASGAPLRVQFDQPVAAVWSGSAGPLQRRVLPSPSSEVTLPRTADAGSILVAGAPRTWEAPVPSVVAWFPAGAAASAVASPAPGSSIHPNSPITLTFSTSVDQALGNARPPVSPITAGTWQTVNAHTIVFHPQGYGYGLGSTVSVGLPNGVKLVGGQGGASTTGTWTVPPGSTLRLQQLLSKLGYLPLQFNGAGVPLTPAAQETAAVSPPPGTFSWAYPNVPSALQGMWAPGSSGPMTRGALMAFQNDHGITPDGSAGAATWRALIDAEIAGKRSTFGYSFVMVSEASNESLTLWHNGRNIVTTPVNTGISSAPTAQGTFPVFDHERVGTMSGTNPDGSHYDDPGIQFISYFNGGDALHAFDRASFGTPQSLGCVEMELGPAGQVFPYTPIGTLVHVA